MRRLLLLATLFLASASPASAQWGETPPVTLGADEVATCLRDAGGGRVAALAALGRRYGASLHTVTPEGLQPDGEVLLGRHVQSCPVAAAASSGAAVVAVVVRRAQPVLTRLLVSVREPGGGFGTPIEIARLRWVEGFITPAVAVSADGSAAVVWRETQESLGPKPARGTLRVARRAPGGGFGPPETLAGRMRGDLLGTLHALAFDAQDALTVVWARPRQNRGNIQNLSAVDVATAAPGRRFGTPQRLADEVQDVSGVALATGSDGRALLAHDGTEQVRVYERAPGGAAFAPAAEVGGFPGTGARKPAVALAADGGAVVAWSDAYGEGIQAMARTGAGAFAPAVRLRPQDDGGVSAFGVFTSDRGAPPYDDETDRVRAVAAPGGRAAVGWIQEGTRFGAAASGRLAVRFPTGFAPAVTLGSPVRDVGGMVPWLGTGEPAAVWADNRTVTSIDDYPIALGRLHISQTASPAPVTPPPSVTLSARPQALYYDTPLIVDAECAAACDLRAIIAPRGKRRSTGELRGAAAGTGARATAGHVRLRIRGAFGHIAPRDGGTVRVVVHATAPGGRAVRRTAVRVRVRRRTPPPFQRPLDVRARRAGGDVIVTWRTAGPARRMVFSAFGRRTRGKGFPRNGRYNDFAVREGHGDRRFRVRLEDVPRSRWVVLGALLADPPGRYVRIVVPVR